jgi:hypothetical protein
LPRELSNYKKSSAEIVVRTWKKPRWQWYTVTIQTKKARQLK